jgi:hypothetical protein
VEKEAEQNLEMVGRGSDWSLKLKIEDRSILKLKNQGTI